jgi:diguanylate cyclase (GGDEF)-like protein
MLDTIEAIWNRRQHHYAFDESTGLARRGPFHDHLTHLLEQPESASTTAVGVIFVDLDNLKRINDVCGHTVGDKAVAAVGRIIRETVRADQQLDFVTPGGQSDYSASRHGGDEFLVALELKTMSDITHVAPRLKHNVDDPGRQTARGYDGPVRLTSSVGGVVYELPNTPATVVTNMLARELVRAADEQMYASKRDGLIHIAAARFTDRLEVDTDYARLEPWVAARGRNDVQ